MNIFFDVDYTLLGLDNTLRPGTMDTFHKLLADGHCIYIWSGVGLRWEMVREHKLEPMVSGVYEKPTDRFHERLEGLGVPLVPDFVIDDYPEIVAAFGGVWVPPYFFKKPDDGQMERIYSIITDYLRDGHSEDRQYKARGTTLPLF